MFSNGRLQLEQVFPWLLATALLLFVGAVASQWFGSAPGTTATSGTERPRSSLPARPPVQQISVSVDGETLLVVHGRPYRPLEYCLYDLETLNVLRVLAADHEAWQTDATCVSRAVLCGPEDDVVLAAGRRDGTVVVFKNAQGTVHRLHDDLVSAVACARGGRTAASADGLLRVWDTASGRILKTIESPGAVRSLAFSADGIHLAGTTYDDALLVWDWANDRLLLRGDAPHLVNMAFSADGRYLLTGHIHGDLRLWSVAATGQPWHSVASGADAIRAIQFLPDSRSFVCANVLGDLEVWSDGGLKSSAVLPARISGDASLAVSRDGRRLYIGSVDGAVDIWDVDPLQETGLIVRQTDHGS